MHGGEASGVHSIRDTGWRTVNNHTDGQSVRMLPSVSLEVCHVLPDKPVGDTTIVVIVQQLENVEDCFSFVSVVSLPGVVKLSGSPVLVCS